MLPAIVTFLSALLLFMVQLLMGKLLLPWFGGTPAVWSTCMLFFQVLLLAGYAYAHGLTRLPDGMQGRIHAALLVFATVLLGAAWWRWGSPLIPDASWKPTGNDAPQARILALLLVSIGLPFFLLSTTSPLIQHWQGRQRTDGKIWRLYAISNTGSLLGLLGYPFLIERFVEVPVQAIAWAAAFAVFAFGAAVLALRSRGPAPQPIASAVVPNPSLFTLLVWLILPLTTSAMLLAVTNELCQEIAAVPFLWMLPLALYLLSFILCFERPAWYHRRFFLAAGGEGGIYNVGSSKEMVILDLAKLIFELTDFHPAVEALPAPPGSVRRRLPDVAKIKKFGFCETVSLEQGIRRCLDPDISRVSREISA